MNLRREEMAKPDSQENITLRGGTRQGPPDGMVRFVRNEAERQIADGHFNAVAIRSVYSRCNHMGKGDGTVRQGARTAVRSPAYRAGASSPKIDYG